MADRRAVWIAGLLAVQAALLWATWGVPGFGAPMWHHAASLLVALGVCAAFWRPLARSRRFLAFGVLAFTVLATASGFWLLYWKEGLRVDGTQDWARAWHVLWSWFAMVFFFQHTWINRAAYAGFVRRTVASRSGLVIHLGTYALIIAAFILTWSAIGRGWFTNDNYIPLSFYAWILFVVPPYLIWGYVRAGLTIPFARERVARLFTRTRVQVWFSVAIVPIAALAIVSGIPLTFLDDPLGAAGLKYVSKYWHVWPSVAFAMLVFGHSIHSWPRVQVHWRSYTESPGARHVGPSIQPGAGSVAARSTTGATRVRAAQHPPARTRR